MHGLFHARQALLARAGQARCLIGGAGHFGHGAHQVTRGGGNLARGRADFGGGSGGFRRRGLLLLGSRGDLGHRGGDLHRRALRLGHQVGECLGHFVETTFDGAELVLAVQAQAHAQVARAKPVEGMHDTQHWRGDSAHQQQPADAGRDDCQQQRNRHAALGGAHRADDLVGRGISRDPIVLDQVIEVLASIDPGRGEDFVDQPLGFAVVARAVGIQHLANEFDVVLFQLDKAVEASLVRIVANGLLVAGHMLLQPLFEALEQRQVSRRDFTPIGQPHQLLAGDIAVDPRTADHRAVVDTGNAVGPHRLFGAFDRHQPRVGGHDHQQHDGDDHGETCQDPLAQGPVLHIQPSGIHNEREKSPKYSLGFLRFCG
ncbi:hypothetical protein D3C79_537480 [compost metagenome]